MTWIFYSSSAPRDFRMIYAQVRVPLACARDKHDCTHKESLYSTYPYLTNSNKTSTLPVMTKRSTLGYREKNDISASALGIMAKSSVENSFPFNARVCTLNRQPNPNPNPSTLLQYNYCTTHDTSNYCHNTASHIINIISSIYYLGLTHHFWGTTFKSNYLYFYLHYLK